MSVVSSLLVRSSGGRATAAARNAITSNPQRLLSANNGSIFLRNQQRNITAAAANGASATNFEQSQQKINHSWQAMAVAAAAATGLGLLGVESQAACEEASASEGGNAETPPSADTKNTEKTPEELEKEEAQRWVIGPDDPFYTVPEGDEPTDCQMCLTFRQGPCRIDWKRFELCVKNNDPSPAAKADKDDSDEKDDNDNKDNDDTNKDDEAAAKKSSEEGATACMKYAMPFYTCSHKHVNTYLILGNEQTEKTVIKPLMETYNSEKAQSRRLCWTATSAASIQMNWENWEGFVGALYDIGGFLPTKFKLDKTKFASAAEALKATWDDKDGNQHLMMSDDGVPYLISIQADVPKQHDPNDDTMKLMMTFALDQNGNLLGDARNKDLDDKKDEDSESSSSGADDSDAMPSLEAAEASSSTVDLQIQLVPGVTEKFTVYGLYIPKDGDFLDDGILLESKPYDLDKISINAVKKAKAAAKQSSEAAAAGGDESAKTETAKE